MTETPNRTTLDAMAELDAEKGERFHDAAGLFSEVKFSRYDTVDYLKTEGDIAAYLDTVREDGDPALIAAAVHDVARARARIAGMADTKRERPTP